jgi:hypothetical protein
VLLAAGAFVTSRVSDEFDVCDTQTTELRGEAQGSRETCKPLPVQDIVPLLLVALAFLWPDLTHVELFGLGRVVRRLDVQEMKQDQLEGAQNKLEATVLSSAQAHATQRLEVHNYANSPDLAQLAERVDALERQQRGHELKHPPEMREGEKAVSEADPWAAFESAAAPLRPWLEVARRLANDERFAQAVRDAGERPWESDKLTEVDKNLLRSLAYGGARLDVAALQKWAEENHLAADVVRDAFRAGTSAAPDSLRVATRLARLLYADLERRGLIGAA